MTDIPQDTRMALGELLGTQRHLVKSVDLMGTNFTEFRKEIRDEQSAISKRLASLEQFKWQMMGLAAASGFVLPVITSVMVWWITKGTP